MLDPELAKKLQARKSLVDNEGTSWTKRPEASSADARGEWLIVEADSEDWSLLPSRSGEADAEAPGEGDEATPAPERPRPAPASAPRATAPRPVASFLPPARTAAAASTASGAAGAWAGGKAGGGAAGSPAKGGEGLASKKPTDEERPAGSQLDEASSQEAASQKPSSERERIERERAAWAIDCARRWPELLREEPPEEAEGDAAGGEAGSGEAHSVSDKDLRVIKADIQRTRAVDPAFQVPEMHAKLETMLTNFCLQERVGYTQGLHEIAAAFAFVQSAAPAAMDEASALSCLASFVHRFVPYFHDKEEFVALHISLLFFRQLLFYHHPDLHNQLEEADVSPFLYATPWFITLFGSRTPLSVLLRFWDKYIIRNEACFLPFMAVALLVSRKAAILSAGLDQAHSEVVQAGVKNMEQLEDVWAAAEDLRAQTPQSFLLRLSRVLEAVKDKRGLQAPAERPWGGRVLAQVEKERYFLLLPPEVVAYFVIEIRAAAAAAAAAAENEGTATAENNKDGDSTTKAPAPAKAIKPRLRLLLLDVRPLEEYSAEHLPQALHFHPPCLRRLVASYRSGQPRLERLAAALSSAVSSTMKGFMAGASASGAGENPQGAPEQPPSAASTPATGSSPPRETPAAAAHPHAAASIDEALVAEVLEALKLDAAERWGEEWISESARAHLVLMGGVADVADAAGDTSGGGGAVAPLYEALTEHLSLARVSVVMGGAPAVHKEALKRGLELEQGVPDAPDDGRTRGESLLGSAWSRLQAASEKLPAADAVGERMGGLLGRGATAARTLAGEAAQAAHGIAGSGTVTSVRQRAAEGISAVWNRLEKFDWEASLSSNEHGADNNSEAARVWPCEIWLTQASASAAADGPPPLVEELPPPAALRLTAARELQLLAAYSAEGGGEGAVAHVFRVEELVRICMPPSRPGVLSFYFPGAAGAAATGEASGEESKRRQPTFLARFPSADQARECARAIAGFAAAAKKRQKASVAGQAATQPEGSVEAAKAPEAAEAAKAPEAAEAPAEAAAPGKGGEKEEPTENPS